MPPFTCHSALSLDTLAFPVRLGVTEEERASPQEVRVDLRIFFTVPPDCIADDHAPFPCYEALAQKLIDHAAPRQYRLLEFLCGDLLRVARACLDEQRQDGCYLWLRVSKHPPVPFTLRASAFELTDLPDGLPCG